MWAVRCDYEDGPFWLSLGVLDAEPYLCWGFKDERILFQDRKTAVKALRASPWDDKKVLVHVSNY